MNEKRKVIIDTDPGHDDALAILLMEKSALFDIKAITTVAGNSSIQNTTNNARFVLDLINSPTPIYSGADKPLKRELIQANVHGENGLAGADITKTEQLTEDAVDRIIEIVRANPGEVSILTLGPLTNVAQAFLKDKELPSLVSEIVMMAGAIEVPGNKNRVAEFNVFVDPDAAKVVFEADVKKTIVPLDACNDISLTLEDFQTIADPGLREPIIGIINPYIKGIQEFEKTSGALMYDVLAAYFLVNPSAFTNRDMDIQIETESELTRGMTVADRRNWGLKKENTTVVKKIDEAKFREDFFMILNQ